MEDRFEVFVGIDWGQSEHRVCVLGADGEVRQECKIEHSAPALQRVVDD